MKKLVFAAFCLLAPLAVSANTVTSFNYFTAVDDYNPYLWLSQRYVTHNDCAYQDAWTLRIWRNAIYARHGYIFKSNDLYNFFRQYSWYNPRYSNVEKKLSKIERANVAFIKRYEY